MIRNLRVSRFKSLVDIEPGLVGEGPTDLIGIEAALQAILAGRIFVLAPLHPEDSLCFGKHGGGWAGVYRWCRKQPGGLTGNMPFLNNDVLIIHRDADVASASYSQGNIEPRPTDRPLPCAAKCPPARHSPDALREVLLSWRGELFPRDKAIPDIECYANPEARLARQPKAKRIRRGSYGYRANAAKITSAWPNIAALTGAARFPSEFRATT